MLYAGGGGNMKKLLLLGVMIVLAGCSGGVIEGGLGAKGQDPCVPTTTTIPTTTTTTIPVVEVSGILTSAQEIAALPTSGGAWDRMNKAANGAWGTPNVNNQDSKTDTNVLAGALVGVRTNNEAMKQRVRDAIKQLVDSHPYDRVLALARELPSYIYAADLVELTPYERDRFELFLAEAADYNMTGHSGANDLRGVAQIVPNNWGTMARAAMAAVALYRQDASELASVANAQAAFLGEPVANAMKFTSTNWHVSPKVSVNPPGATIQGHNVDGVLPEDQRRTGEFAWPAPKGSYPHEGLQGAVAASYILDRAGALEFNAGAQALIRAERWLVEVNGNPAEGDDLNTPWMLNAHGGNFATGATTPGKNIGWMDWLLG
jgi:hypothetical protein